MAAKPKNGSEAPDPTTKALRAEFSRRLQAAMIKKGWTQSDLARAAAKHMPNGRFGRDSISKYLRKYSLPEPLSLNAVSRALGVSPDELLPDERGYALATGMTVGSDALEIRTIDNEHMHVRINQTLPKAVAMAIMAIITKAQQ